MRAGRPGLDYWVRSPVCRCQRSCSPAPQIWSFLLVWADVERKGRKTQEGEDGKRDTQVEIRVGDGWREGHTRVRDGKRETDRRVGETHVWEMGRETHEQKDVSWTERDRQNTQEAHKKRYHRLRETQKEHVSPAISWAKHRKEMCHNDFRERQKKDEWRGERRREKTQEAQEKET